jgi:hypothetical protein
MRPKMHGLLLDTSINSASTVRLNIYQVREVVQLLHVSFFLLHKVCCT